jgi:hypothetical protein
MKKISVMIAVTILTACGGGGSSDDDPVETDPIKVEADPVKQEEAIKGEVYTPFERGYSLDSRDALDSSQKITGVWLLAGEKKSRRKLVGAVEDTAGDTFADERLFYYQLVTISAAGTDFTLNTCDFYGADGHTALSFELNDNQYKQVVEEGDNKTVTDQLSFVDNKIFWMYESESESDGYSYKTIRSKEGYKIAETALSLELGKFDIRYITQAGVALLPENSEYDISCFHIAQSSSDVDKDVSSDGGIELVVVADSSADDSRVEVLFDGTLSAKSTDEDNARVSLRGVTTETLSYGTNDYQTDYSASIDDENAAYSITLTDLAGRNDTASFELQLILP